MNELIYTNTHNNELINELQDYEGIMIIDLYHWEIDDDGYLSIMPNQKISSSIS